MSYSSADMPQDVSSLRISPSEGSLAIGAPVQLRLLATTRSGGTDLVPGNMALWSSSDDKVADVNRQGRLTPRSPGRVTITVSYAGLGAQAILDVLERK